MPRKKSEAFYKPYWALAFLRVLLVFITQNGYIHPDEFFQSMEVLIGRFFAVEANKPWEFTTQFPIRSITLPYFLLGFAYQILLILNRITQQFLFVDIVKPYTLIIFPRLLICLLSFLVDYSIYKICVNNNEKYKSRLVILGSSYVIIVFGTRTFSNTFELILFALLLYFVSESMSYSNMIIKQKEYLNRRYEKSKTVVEKAKIHKLRLYLNAHSLRNCLEISTVCVVGFFNRPTFLAYAVSPVFFWLYRGLGSKSVISLHFHLRILSIITFAIPTILLFTFIDSMFYGFLTWAEIEFFAVSIENFVFTPYNFLKYNANSDNLSEHGIHPRFLHVLVNMPLLFNILALYGFTGIGNLVKIIIRKKLHLLPTVRSIKGLMTCSLITPICLLSVIPHQEPRFLIPLLVPLVYLYGNCILEERNYELVEVSKDSITQGVAEKVNATRSSLKLWLVLNIIFVVFFGYVHQAGVLPAASHLSKEIRGKPTHINFNIITSHIYSIPESLFLQRSTERLYSTSKTKFKVQKRVALYEKGSKGLTLVLDDIGVLLNSSASSYNVTYVVLPTSLKEEFEFLTVQTTRKFSIRQCVNFYPHLSTEAFPDFRIVSDWFFNNSYRTLRVDDLVENFLYFLKSFGVALCQITKN